LSNVIEIKDISKEYRLGTISNGLMKINELSETWLGVIRPKLIWNTRKI